MELNIIGRHIEITDAIKLHARNKTDKLPRFYNSINHVRVVIDGNERNNICVRIIASAEHNKVFIAEETSKDAYKSIDLAVHKLERQLRKIKGKERNHKHSVG